MKFITSLASVFIVNHSAVCWHYGSFELDSGLITYASVYCTKFPLSESSMQCLENNDEILNLNKVMDNIE